LALKEIFCYFLDCGNIFCNSCTNNYILIPALHLTQPVRVCRDCLPTIDDNNNNTTIESTRTATPMPIQSGGCRQSNGTPNGSFNSPGGQKVKG
jgi:hypothetical protein